MKTLTVTKASQLGDRDPKYGQTWWAEVEEQEEPVMFNLMGEDEVQEGDSLTAEEVLLKTSSKGTEYHRLKKVQVKAGDTPRLLTPDKVAKNDLEERVAKLEKAVFGDLLDEEEPTDTSDIPF